MHIDSREQGELVDSSIKSPALPASRTFQLYGTRLNDPISDYCWLRDSNLLERLQTYPELNLDIKSNNDGSTNRSC